MLLSSHSKLTCLLLKCGPIGRKRLVAGSTCYCSRSSGRENGHEKAVSTRPLESSKSALGSLLSKLSTGKVSLQLHQNIFLNPNRKSSLQHIEVTDDRIRLEFSKATEEFKSHAELMWLSEEEQEKMGIPKWLVPKDLKNLTYCGGGATIELDKKGVLEYLTRRRLSSPKQETERTQDEASVETLREDEHTSRKVKKSLFKRPGKIVECEI